MARNIKVIVSAMGQDPKNVEVDADLDPTVRCVLQRSGFRLPETKDIRLNNEPADLDTEVEDGDTITVTGRVAGGVRG